MKHQQAHCWLNTWRQSGEEKRKTKSKKEKKMTKCSPTGCQYSTYSAYWSYDDVLMVRRSRGWSNPPRPSMDSFRSSDTSTLMLISWIRILGHRQSFLFLPPPSEETQRHARTTSRSPSLYTFSVYVNNAPSAPKENLSKSMTPPLGSWT